MRAPFISCLLNYRKYLYSHKDRQELVVNRKKENKRLSSVTKVVLKENKTPNKMATP